MVIKEKTKKEEWVEERPEQDLGSPEWGEVCAADGL